MEHDHKSALTRPIIGARSAKETAMANRALDLFDEFARASEAFRRRMDENEKLWRGQREQASANEPNPATPMLFSTTENLLADIMDNYPEPVILGEEPGDEETARALTELVRGILKRRNYKRVYREKCRAALKKGVSVQEVFWDNSLCGGLGDVNIRNWDARNFLVDPLCEQFQQGRAVFRFANYPREWFVSRYGEAFSSPIANESDIDDRTEPFDERTADGDAPTLIEYWYKERTDDIDTVHMARLCGTRLLEHTKRDFPDGIYAHGMYPFLVEPLYRFDGEPLGMGVVDIYKDMQAYIDKLDAVILKNALMSSKVKLLVNRGAEIEEDALMDWNNEVIRGSRIDENAVRWFQSAPISPYAAQHFAHKIQLLRDESGQNQFARGDGGKGVTAASAILALQDAGSKRSRMLIAQMYDGFSELVQMMLQVIRENYTEKRLLRIAGDDGEQKTVALSADSLKRDGERGIDFDVTVQVQKASPFHTAVQNDFAMQLLRLGALSFPEAIEIMQFEGRDKIAELLKARPSAAAQPSAAQSVMQQSAAQPTTNTGGST